MYKAVLEEKRAEQLEYDECALMILCKLNNHQVGYDECVDDRPSIKRMSMELKTKASLCY